MWLNKEDAMGKKLYGKTTEEISAANTLECRDIVKTIMEYGITQQQILLICKLLSLELEDGNTMKRISSLVNEFLQNDSVEEKKIVI